MFTGIVQHRGMVADVETTSAGVRLTIDHEGWAPPDKLIAPDQSICVSGVCLTVVDSGPGRLSFNAIAETLAKSTLGDLQQGDAVNLEPALSMGDPLGGHMVQGHVDGVGKITRVQAGEDWRLTIRPPEALMDYIAPKGSICVSGVSLTVATVRPFEFEVALIPTTLDLTTLGGAFPGMPVNLETDMIARQIVHYLKRQDAVGGESTVSMDTLREAGFLDGGA